MSIAKKIKIAAATAIPALSLIAAAATTAAPAQAQTTQARSAACNPNGIQIKHAGPGNKAAIRVIYDTRTHCVYNQYLDWQGSAPGRTEMVRYYSARGHLIGEQRLAGSIVHEWPSSNTLTAWDSLPKIRGVYKVSIALVPNHQYHHTVLGPVYFNIP